MLRKLREDNAELEERLTESHVRYRDLRAEADALLAELTATRLECAKLRDRMTRMISGVVEGAGTMGSYCRLVASMTVDELSGVVPVSVQDAGAASGGVGAMIAAIR
jgi:predicted  nucleic acid-binding Zn-ribbon protein